MPRKLASYLDSTPAMQSLVKQAQRLIEMQQVLTEIAPKPLAQSVRVGCLTHSSLLLLADNGAVAAKVTQLTPSLLMNFRERGYEVTAIRVEVQPPRGCAPQRKKIGLSGKALGHLQELATHLPKSPLRTALEDLLARASYNKDQPLEQQENHYHQKESNEKPE